MREILLGLGRRFRDEIGVYRSVVADPRCPRLARWTLGGAMAYALSPIDLIPDFIPVLGYLDDVILLPAAIVLCVRMIPAPVLEECRSESSCPHSTAQPAPFGAIITAGLSALAPERRIWI